MSARSKPYQPLLLRLLHGINAFLVFGALITGFLVYNSWDGRFGRLWRLSENRTLIDIHGTFGFFLLFAFVAFAIYSLKAGRKRLIQSDSFTQLTNINRPIGWYSLHRIVNTGMLLAAVFAVFSGKFQDENWLPSGQMNQVWYFIHLIAWVVMLLAIALHLLITAKVGGIPLWRSMFKTQYRPTDSPKLWPQKVRDWLRHPSL